VVDWTIDLGQILTMVSLVVLVIGAHFSLKVRVESLERALTVFGERLTKHEDKMMSLVGQVQRLIGAQEEARRANPPDGGC